MKHKVLIADDQKINRVLIKKTLSQTLDDLEFFEADNGEKVIELLAEQSIDLIILDLVLPVLDGYQVLKAVKQNPDYQDIPVIVNSELKDIKAIEKILIEGVSDYFKKPLSPKAMNTILPLKARNALTLHDQSRTILKLNEKINNELKNAHTFAEIMLPKSTLLRAVDLYYHFDPSLYIGGDCFDCVEIDGKTHFIIADVTGHGIAAGMASSMVKMLYRKTIEKPDLAPDQILESMNKSIFDIFDFSINNNFLMFTAFVGIIDGDKLAFANAGQPYPLLYSAKEKFFANIEQNGFVIGMLEEAEYETQAMDFTSGDALLLYTDGLFCSGDKGDFSDWEKVCKVANQFQLDLLEDPQQFLEEIYTAFEIRHLAHNSCFTDDVALMLLTKK